MDSRSRHAYTLEELAEGVDLYIRHLKVRLREPGEQDA